MCFAKLMAGPRADQRGTASQYRGGDPDMM